MKKRLLSLLLVVLIVLGMLPATALAADEGASNLEFDVTDPDGYVTISFVDNGIRPDDAAIENEELYGTAVGTIIEETRVPYVDGDSVADVTVRLLKALNIKYEHTGTVDNGFYLATLKLEKEINGKYYATFGEFDAGSESGWCVRLNNWHINQGTSAFKVEDGDVVSWLYTCQFGADVGANFETKSAEITGITFADEYGTLSPAFSKETESYTYEVPANISSIAFDIALENYASVLTLTVDGNEVRYRPNKEISVGKNSKIEISTALDYMDADNNNEITTYTDKVTIQLVTENNAPTVAAGAPAKMTATVGEEISVDLSTLFTDADGDTLTYTVKVGSGDAVAVEGSVYKGTLPAAGDYEVVLTASDGKNSVSHTVTITASAGEDDEDNTPPNIKEEFAEEKSKTYIYGSTYVYIYMDDIFEDADGDTLTYSATLNGEKVEIVYNTFSKEYYIQFATKPAVREYKIVANDGKADSEVFTARCIGTSATITASEDAPLIPNGNYLYYVMGTAEDDTFALNYTLDVDEEVPAEWTSSNTSVLTSNGDGTFTVGDVTSRQQPYVGLTSGIDSWGSPVYLGTKYLYILPGQPEVEDVTIALPEHADNVVPTTVSNAFNGWYSSEFDYVVEDPSVASVAVKGTYGIDVTPKALGTTTVTATFKYDPNIKCSFTVTVTGRSLQIEDQPDSGDVIFTEGKKVQLEVLGAVEGETFTWTSSDESVATVDNNGVVTVKKLGQTYITAVSSLSTETAPLKASMYLQVKEKDKVYLDDLALTQYSYFGHISAKAGFNAAQLEYDWDMQENRYSYSTLQFTPYFDSENLNAVLNYQVSGGEYQKMSLTDEKAVSITNGLVPGENIITIEVSPKDDAENITTYTFNIFRPYNPTNTVTRMTVYPGGETALAYPTYLNNREGTLFQLNAETGEFIAGWNGQPSTGWSSSRYTYKTYIYGARSSVLTIMPTFGYADQRVMIYVDGTKLEEAVTNWESADIPVDEDGTKIELYVNSEKYHAEKLAAGVEDPYAEPEMIYTIYVENVTPLGIESEILAAELDGGEFYAPGFSSKTYTVSGLIPSDQSSAELTFTVPAGIDVYKTSVSDANKMTAVKQDEDGNNVYTTTLTVAGSYSTTNIILQVTDPETNETGMAQYAFTLLRRGAKDVYPDEVVEYIAIGSQYTNYGNYGTMPERTLKTGGGVLSLGNFGGYIVYKYDKPIENDPNNPYGVDFVVYGNSFGNGAHEPGYVQVSEDGKTWYTLAGSDHYEDHNDWDFSMTYTNNNGKSAWKNSDGESGQIYNYPIASAYPYFTWTEELEKSMTVSGPRLNSSAKDIYGSAAAVLPDFGYVDVNTNGAINGKAVNPYAYTGTLKSGGDQFDLSWAVDENGMPVELSSVSYIRIATASSIYAGAIGEKSTEVSAVNRVTNAAESAVGETTAPASIMINGSEITVPEDDGIVSVAVEEGELTVNVTASVDAHIYINDTYGSDRTYAAAPEKGIVRIIVQEGEKEPYICYVKLLSLAATEVVELINAIGTVTLDSEEKIAAAREAYDALTEEQQAYVENYETLVAAEEKLDELKTEKIYKDTGAYLEGLAEEYPPTVNTTGGEWLVIGLTRSGRDVPEGYYDNAAKYVEAEILDGERLHRSKSTDNSRVILALTAAGYDVTDVAGHNLLVGLTDMTYVKKQGINGPIWALIAFDSHDYEIPAGGDVTRDALIGVILDAQLSDGGWALSGKTADADMTGMALQALAPYYSTNADVKAAVDKAVACLSGMQHDDGTFSTVGDKTSESSAQVIVALTALGIDPDKDSRFIKNGISAVDALCGYAVEGGGFKHLLNGKIDGMATEQSYYALTAYNRFLDGENFIYDMTDVEIDTDDGDNKDDGEKTPVYKIISGADSVWTKESGKDVTITSDGEFSEFNGLKVDGNLIDAANYTAKAGSTVVILKTDYLEKLTVGKHTVTFVFDSQEVSTSLTVKAAETTDDDNKTDDEGTGTNKPSDSDTPATGDDSYIAIYALVLALSLTAVILLINKKKLFNK